MGAQEGVARLVDEAGDQDRPLQLHVALQPVSVEVVEPGLINLVHLVADQALYGTELGHFEGSMVTVRGN